MTEDYDIKDFLSACADATDVSQVWRAALDYLNGHGVAMVSYHLRDSGDLSGSYERIVEDGYPKDWVCEYIEKNLRVVDPLPGLAARLSTPFLWSQAEALTILTPDEAEYLDKRKAFDLGDGLAFQVNGPDGRNAYVGLGFGNTVHQLSARQMFELQCVAQCAHIRYCQLTKGTKRSVDLSPRELEILRWMARGKSNPVIAEILGISRHTVDTISRRLFEKLDVNDRMSAAMKGLGSGLLQFRQSGIV